MKIKELIFQIIKFGFVGVIACIIDVGVLVFLNEKMRMDVLWASAISFSVSVIANYLLSMRFVFKAKEQSKIKEFVLFTGLSIGGLFINQIIMWAGTKLLSVHYLYVKVFALIFVPIYNFVSRKIFLEKRG